MRYGEKETLPTGFQLDRMEVVDYGRSVNKTTLEGNGW